MFAARAAFMTGATPPPTYVSVSPSSGVAGTSITVTGTNFIAGLTTVTIGGVSATSVSVTNSTTLTCTVPTVSSTNGAYNIAITTPSGTGTGTGVFTFYAPATITGFSPGSFYSGSGGAMTITGTNFTAGATVSVGGNAASSVVVGSATSITCTFPALGLGSYTVTVTATGGNATSSFGYVAPPVYPVVSSVSPSSTTTASQTFTVYGSGFNATGSLLVLIDGSYWATGVTIYSDTTATFVTSGTAGAHSVAVYNYSGGYSNTLSSAFTCIGAPTLSGVSPNTNLPVAGGTSLTLTGTNFISGGTTVSVGGTSATGVSVGSSTSLTCTAPANASGSQTVTVSTGSGTSGGVAVGYALAPTLSSVSPTSGLAGSSATLTGSNFIAAGTSCSVSGFGAVSVSVTSSTSGTITIPAAGAGAKTLSVTTVGGTSGGVTFTVTVPAPTISSTADGRSGFGSQTGSTISLIGTNFTGASVTIGGTAVAPSVTSTTISFTCPNLSTDGAKTIAVTTGGGTVNTSVTFWAAKSAAVTNFTTGSGSYSIPGWANAVDYIALGGGGGGNGGGGGFTNGGGGGAGTFASGTLTRTSQSTLTYSVGGGGSGGPVNTAGTAGTASTANGVSGAGGAAGKGQGVTLDGYGAGNSTLNGMTAFGGGATATGNLVANCNKPGNAPGGGGSGGQGGLTGVSKGGNGAAGAVWFQARQ